MIRATDIHSITDFQRNPKGFLSELKESKSPIVLTVNGKAEFVVQDAESYQEMIDKIRAAEDLEEIRRGVDESLTECGDPVKEVFADLRKKHGL